MSCITKKKNLGLSKCLKLPGYLKGFIETPENFFFTPVQMATSAAFKTAVQNLLIAEPALRGYFFPLSKKTDNQSTDAAYEDTPVAKMPVDDGKYEFRFHIRENMCLHTAMSSHNASSGRFIPVDKQNNLILTEDEDGNGYGLRFSMLKTEKFSWTDGTGQATTSPVVVTVEDNLELDGAGLLVEAPFIGQIQRLTDVTLTIVGSPSATTIVVTVAQSCDGTAVNGLVVADFLLKTTAGATQTITSLVEVDGQYTLTDTDFATGTLTLVPPDELSVLAYEAEAAVTVTVV